MNDLFPIEPAASAPAESPRERAIGAVASIDVPTSLLRAPEWAASKHVQRATWLCVVVWAAEQGYGERIKNGRRWDNAQWEQMCGVTLDEILSAGPLITCEGDDLLIWNFKAIRLVEHWE